MITQTLALAIGISRADARLRRLLDTRLGGIGYTEFLIMLEISTVVGGRLRAIDLAERLLMTPSGVTRALLPMQKVGLVERTRHERDARSSFVSLTAAGEAMLAEKLPAAERIVEETFGADLTPSARLTILGFFERLGYVTGA